MAEQLTQEEMKEKLASMSPEEIKEMQKQQCPFCQIIAGKIPSKKIFEDDKVIAILDINPAVAGHALLLPKEHYGIMPFVPDEILAHMAKIAKYISKAFLKQLLVKGSNIFIANGQVAGQQAQHFMMHLIPREEGDGIEVFALPEGKLTEEMEKAKSMISQNLHALMKLYLEKYPTGKKVPEIPRPTEEQLIQMIEQNLQLKEILTKQPAQFKELVAKHPQLSQLFKGIDLDKFIAKFSNQKSDNTEKKQETKIETKPKESVDLDAISQLLESESPKPKLEKTENKSTPRIIEEQKTESAQKETKPKAPKKKEISIKQKEQNDNQKDKPKKTSKNEDVDLDSVLDLLGGGK